MNIKHDAKLIAIFGAAVIAIVWFWSYRQKQVAAAQYANSGANVANIPTVPAGTDISNSLGLNPGVYASNQYYGLAGVDQADFAAVLNSVNSQILTGQAGAVPPTTTSATQASVIPPAQQAAALSFTAPAAYPMFPTDTVLNGTTDTHVNSGTPGSIQSGQLLN